MPSLAKQYTAEIYAQRRYWATWEPNVHLSLGTCGPVQKGIFRPEGKLDDYAIDFKTDRDPKASDTDYSSRKGLQITFQLAAGANTIPNIPQGSAGLRIAFTRKRAAVVAVKGGREDRIADQNRLRREILERARAGTGIPDGWFVVTHLVACKSATVIVAQGSGAELQVSAKADFTAGVVDVANANLDLAIAAESNIGYKMLAQEGATPLFRGLRLKRTWLGNPKLETFGPDTPGEQIDELFEELTPDTVADE